jgi:hypothetical protein
MNHRIVREAIHCWFCEKGIDDELSYDQKDHEKWLEETFPWWNDGRNIDPEKLRRLLIEQHNQQTNL